MTSSPTPLTIQPTSNTSDTETTDEIRVRPPEPVIPPSPETTSGHVANHEIHVSDSTHRTTDTPHQNISRLPKLSLPFFSGDPLMWQTFWDSFNAAVHTNTNLTGVKRFNYLRAQLQGDAARVVAGFPLTDVNYQHSITLLRERFGQPYKLINAHMQALLNLTNVTNTPSSLHYFMTLLKIT